MLSLGVGDYIAGTVVVRDKYSEENRPDWNTSPGGNSLHHNWHNSRPRTSYSSRRIFIADWNQTQSLGIILHSRSPLESRPRPEFSGHPTSPASSSQCFFSRPTYSKVSLKTKVLLASFGNSATGTSRRTFKPPARDVHL